MVRIKAQLGKWVGVIGGRLHGRKRQPQVFLAERPCRQEEELWWAFHLAMDQDLRRPAGKQLEQQFNPTYVLYKESLDLKIIFYYRKNKFLYVFLNDTMEKKQIYTLITELKRRKATQLKPEIQEFYFL